MIDVARRLPVAPAAVWDVLTDTNLWSQWGPSIRQVTLDHHGTRLRSASTGRVLTAVGIWLPFQVTAWESDRRWEWMVAGIPATAHRVEPTDRDGCHVVIEIPAWAPLYAPLCWVALGRIGDIASRRGDAQPGGWSVA